MDALNDHCVGTHQDAVLHDDRRCAGRLDHTCQNGPCANVAVPAHRSPAPQDGPHVDHGARADDCADVDDCAHHNHRIVADLHLLPDDGAGLNAGVDPLAVQQGDGAVAAVALHHQIPDVPSIFLQDRAQLPPVPEDYLAGPLPKDSGRAIADGGVFIDIYFYRRLLLRRANIGDNLLCVHHPLLPPNKIS